MTTNNHLPYKNVEFYYSTPVDTPKDSWQPKESERWVEDWFMIPRIGDTVLHAGIWWNVTEIYLVNTGVFRIHVSYGGRN